MDNIIFGYVANHSTMSGRRNAMGPDDVENLLRNKPVTALNPKNHMIQRLSSEGRLSPSRKKARSKKDYPNAMTTKTRSSSDINQPSGMTPMTIQNRSVQQVTNDDSICLDWQSNSSVQERQVGKRKRAAPFDEDDYLELQSVFFDVIHPSELKLNHGDMDEQKLATIQDSAMREELQVHSLSAHSPQVNEIQYQQQHQHRSPQAPKSKGGLSSICVSPRDTSFNNASHNHF